MVIVLKAEIEQISNDIKASLSLIESRYNIKECTLKIEELTAISEQDNFWLNNEYAQKIMRQRMLYQ